MEERSNGAHLVGASIATFAVICLVVVDEAGTFEWLLARLLGASLVWLGWSTFLWLQGRKWWTEFFTWALVGEAGLALINRTFLGYIPVLWPVIWASGPVLSLVFAGGVREVTKDRKWDEQKSMGICLGAGLVLHYVLIAGLVDAILVLLMGQYPGPN